MPRVVPCLLRRRARATAGLLLAVATVGLAQESRSGEAEEVGEGYLRLDRTGRLARLGFGASMIRMATEDHPPVSEIEDPSEGIAESLSRQAERHEAFRRAEVEFRRTWARSSSGEWTVRPGGEGGDRGGLDAPGEEAPEEELAPREVVSPEAFLASRRDLLEPVEVEEAAPPPAPPLAPASGAEPGGSPPVGGAASRPMEGPDAFLRRADELLDSVDSLIEAGGTEDAWSEEGTAEDAEELEDVRAPEDPGDFLSGLGLSGAGDRGVVRQRITVGLLDSEYDSVSEGSTTTESRYVTHYASYEKALSERDDLLLTNELTVDTLRNRDVLDARVTRQFTIESYAEAAANLTVHQQKIGEPEPDYLAREFSLAGGRDAFPNWGVDGRVYRREQDYDETDIFYLDTRAHGAELGARYSEDELDLGYRMLWDRERYPAGPENDVDRLRHEWDAFYPFFAERWYAFDALYTNTFQREGIENPGLLDPYREWFQELALVFAISPVLTFENAYTRYSRAVDRISAFLYDGREYGKRRRLTFRPSGRFDGSFTLRTASLRNRDKDPFDAIDEKAEDQERDDYELYLHFARGPLDAGLTLYWGETVHVRGESLAFPDQERSGYAFRLTYAFHPAWSLEVNSSHDEEEHAAFPANDIEYQSLGASLSYSF